MSSPTNWSGKLVRKYGPEILDPNPSEGTIAELIPFQSKAYRPGEGYYVDVRLAHEQGVVREISHGITALSTGIDSVEKQANLEGAEIHVSGRISYGMIHKLESGQYGSGIESKIASMMLSGENHREADLLYGPGTSGLASLGTINSVVSGGGGATVVVNITQATWAGGLWPQFLNCEFDAYSAGGVQSNATTALVLTAVSQSNCRLTFTKTAGDTLSAGDLLFFRSARVKSCVGLQGIAENTGSLFGISAATYAQWKAVSYAVGSQPLSFDKVIEGCAQLADNGLGDGLTLLVCNRTWADLMNDEAALRRYTDGKASRKAAPGFDELEFTSNCGVLRVRTHRFMKQGMALGIPTQECERVGSTDLTFRMPGSNTPEFAEHDITGYSGKELRLYSDQAVICYAPWHMIQFTGIANASDAVPA